MTFLPLVTPSLTFQLGSGSHGSQANWGKTRFENKLNDKMALIYRRMDACCIGSTEALDFSQDRTRRGYAMNAPILIFEPCRNLLYYNIVRTLFPTYPPCSSYSDSTGSIVVK